MKKTIKLVSIAAALVLMSFVAIAPKFKAEFSETEKETVLKIIASTAQLIAESDIPTKKGNAALKDLENLHQFLNQRISADTAKAEKGPKKVTTPFIEKQ